MERRLTRDEANLQIARVIAQRSTCQRLSVGCVITFEGRIISTGYNGPLPQDHDCNSETCNIITSCTRAIHAEANAIYSAAKRGISLKGSTMYCTHSPCIDCVEGIIQSGISKVIFEQLFRDEKPLEKLRWSCKITQIILTKEGWQSEERIWF